MKKYHAMKAESANVLCMVDIAKYNAIGEIPSVYEELLGTLDFTLKPRVITKNVIIL